MIPMNAFLSAVLTIWIISWIGIIIFILIPAWFPRLKYRLIGAEVNRTCLAEGHCMCEMRKDDEILFVYRC